MVLQSARGACEEVLQPMKSEAEHIERLASAAKSPAATTTGADLTSYEIEITDGGRKKKLTLDDMSLTAETAPLVELLAQHAKPIPLA